MIIPIAQLIYSPCGAVHWSAFEYICHSSVSVSTRVRRNEQKLSLFGWPRTTRTHFGRTTVLQEELVTIPHLYQIKSDSPACCWSKGGENVGHQRGMYTCIRWYGAHWSEDAMISVRDEKTIIVFPCDSRVLGCACK